MTHYVFTLNARMVAIASACVVLLGILLFLLGVELGKLWAASDNHTKNLASSTHVIPGDQDSLSAAVIDRQAIQNKAP